MQRLIEAGAHYTFDNMWELPHLLAPALSVLAEQALTQRRPLQAKSVVAFPVSTRSHPDCGELRMLPHGNCIAPLFFRLSK